MAVVYIFDNGPWAPPRPINWEGKQLLLLLYVQEFLSIIPSFLIDKDSTSWTKSYQRLKENSFIMFYFYIFNLMAFPIAWRDRIFQWALKSWGPEGVQVLGGVGLFEITGPCVRRTSCD